MFASFSLSSQIRELMEDDPELHKDLLEVCERILLFLVIVKSYTILYAFEKQQQTYIDKHLFFLASYYIFQLLVMTKNTVVD
jgi:hypothetical protein